MSEGFSKGKSFCAVKPLMIAAIRLTILALLALTLACSSRDKPQGGSGADTSYTEDDNARASKTSQPITRQKEAILIARRYVRSKGDCDEYEVTAERNADGRWYVHFDGLPATPGRHKTVIVSDDGTVAGEVGGL